MKKFLLIILIALCAATGYGQVVDENKVFSKIQEGADFPGGNAAWIHFLQDNINPNAPDSTAPRGTHKIIVVFEIEKDGTINNVYCENDPGHGMCEEAIRVIKMSPKWIPAKVEGKDIKSMRRQPIGFSVE
jgi:hypothetical protein